MKKTQISIVTLGSMPVAFNTQKVLKRKSKLYEIMGQIQTHLLPIDSDGPNWEYSDQSLDNIIPKEFEGDFLIAIVNIPLEDNWFARRLDGNRVIVSYHEIKDILSFSKIPLENFLFRILYAYTLLFLRHKNTIPAGTETTSYAHDETRGCLFDMNASKMDVTASCHNPIVCDDCTQGIRNDMVSDEIIRIAKSEIRNIRSPLFFRMLSFTERHPIWSIIISSIYAILLGILGSFIYDKLH